MNRPTTCSLIASALVFAAQPPARADFFDGARKTFTQDIPHFFQDDIPCAFGGQPTSHTKASCKAAPADNKARQPLASEPAPISAQPLPAPSGPNAAAVPPPPPAPIYKY